MAGIVEIPPWASLADVTQIFGCLPGEIITDFTAEKLLIHFPALCTCRFYVHIDPRRMKTSGESSKMTFLTPSWLLK